MFSNHAGVPLRCSVLKEKPQLASLSFFRLYTGDLGKLEQQWRVLVTLLWENTEDFTTKHFWLEVKNHMDAGCEDFDELGPFALSLLAMLTTQMTLHSFMENIICIWAFVQRHEICYHQFGPT